MKKILVFAVALATLAAGAADKAKISLADATGKIGQAIENPAVMEELVSQLSAEDQVAFLARVNAAIESMPVSPAEKTAKYVDINSAAMKSAAKGNLASMLAETFATVPPASLVAINEVFANKLFNRAADPETVFTDEAYTKLAKDTMATIQKRNETADDSGVRDTFAILMFVRGSNGTPADLANQLSANLPDAATRELARNEWIGPALKENNYEPMLGAADAGAQPDVNLVLSFARPLATVAMLSDLSSSGSAGSSMAAMIYRSAATTVPGSDLDAVSGLNRVPRTLTPGLPWNSTYTRGEPNPYEGQGLHD